MKKITLLLTALIISMSMFSQSKKVAISPVFDREKEVSNMYKLMVRISFTKAIANQPNYVALERTNVDKIIDEVKFQETGMVSDDEIKELGNMLGADYVCILEVASDNNQIVISASIVEIETGKVIKNDFIVSDLDNYKIETACKTLADKLFFSNKIYLDANWQPLPNATGAKYYRIVDFINETNRAKVRNYYMNGKIEMEGEGIFNDKSNLSDYIMDGEFTFFDEKGNTTFIKNYKNDVLNGKYIEYYESGKEKIIANNQNGEVDGKLIVLYERGNYEKVVYYKNGKMNGIYEEFFDNGKQKIKTYMVNDYPNGSFKQWYYNGNISMEGNISNNELNGNYTSYYKNGKIHIRGNLKNGFYHGYTQIYYENGQIQFEGNVENGNAEGECTMYYENGKSLTLNFHNGIADYNGQQAEMQIQKATIDLSFDLDFLDK